MANIDDLRRDFRRRMERNENVIDPLMEQMRSVLNLGPRASDVSQSRMRRFSDTDRPESGASSTIRRGPIRPRDTSRLLPTPDEQSHRYSAYSHQRRLDSRVEDQQQAIFSDLPDHTCNAAVCAVTRVFETTELFELILSFLDTKSVLDLRRTSKRWNSTIHESPLLRLHFFMYGQWGRPGRQYVMLPISIPGLALELGDEIHRGQWIVITITLECARRISRNTDPTRRVRARSIYEGLRGGLGNRRRNSNENWPATKSTPTVNSTLNYEDLLITQPPLVGMQAFIVFADEEVEKENTYAPDSDSLPAELLPCAKLSCEHLWTEANLCLILEQAGINLGFLAETAQSLLNSQPAGPSTAKEVKVVFKGIMSFCPGESIPKKRTRTRIVTPI